jgi:hypothetical protein
MIRNFDWAHGTGQVQSLGGMLGPVTFSLPDGQQVQPLQVAPWADDPAAGALPGILRRLRGEWPCVPFGAERDLALLGDWAGFSGPAPANPLPPHGHSSNADWTFGTDLTLTLDYPANSPIARLERRITPDPAAPALDITLTVHPRADVVWPIGLHPTFAIPDSGAVIETASGGMTFPGVLEPGVSVLAAGARFGSLALVPCSGGRAVDMTRLPLAFQTEELVQLTAPGGQIALAFPGEGYRLRMAWDAAVFPGMVLWFSNRGRQAYPWSGRHLALGMEPVCAAFDLGPAISAGPNPLAQAGHRTAHAFKAGVPLTTRLRLSVEPA